MYAKPWLFGAKKKPQPDPKQTHSNEIMKESGPKSIIEQWDEMVDQPPATQAQNQLLS